MGEKKLAEAYILGIPFGLIGAHHFYLGRKVFGIVYACTLGLFGLGYIYDLIRMKWLVRHANRDGTKTMMVSDAYLIGVLGGLFGAHHLYLGNKGLFILYLCTLGYFTMGWIVDLFRMKYLVKDHNSQTKEKSLCTAYILSLPPLGIFGAYHYYLGNWKLGLIYTFTVGTFGIGWIVDLFRMPKLVKKAGLDQRSVGTAYIMSMPPFGLFGAHQYYLGNYFLGVLYTCTLGIFTIGWIVDLFRMKNLVRAANDPTSDHGTTKVTAYIICVSPLGLFGAHHFYLKRYLNGGFYAATLGLFGFGWIFDWFRLPVLYERYAGEDQHKYADEAYLYWFPFGLFGLHHFYLGNKKWGLLYACTLGCLGFGWIIDGIRLPSMLKDFNKYVADPDMNPFRICRPSCPCSVYSCKRCCLNLCSCPCWANFSLSKSDGASTSDATYRAKQPDDFEVIKEMYPNENHEHYNEKHPNDVSNGENQATEDQPFTVQTYDTYPTAEPSAPAYDNGSYPGDQGYDEQSVQQQGYRIPTPPPPPPLPPFIEGTTDDGYDHNADDNYQYDGAHPDDDVRYHEDVNVAVSNEHEEYALQNRNNQSNTTHYQDDLHM